MCCVCSSVRRIISLSMCTHTPTQMSSAYIYQSLLLAQYRHFQQSAVGCPRLPPLQPSPLPLARVFWGRDFARLATEQSARLALEEGADELRAGADEAAQPEQPEPRCPRCECLEPELPAHQAWLRRLASSPGYGAEAAVGGTLLGACSASSIRTRQIVG